MGLTIHYTLKLKADVSPGVVRELVRRTADYARKIGCKEVDAPRRAVGDDKTAPLFFDIGKHDKNGGRFGIATPRHGWVVKIWPGAGCEDVELGLCQYPRRVLIRGKYEPTGFPGGWQLQGFCKTQYAGEHGLENFLSCHLRVISLLDFMRGLGVRVKVNDEGGYWKTRSIEKLRAGLGSYDRLIASMGGAFKDGGLRVESPIFSYKNFERLEHEGQKEFGGRIGQLQKMLAK